MQWPASGLTPACSRLHRWLSNQDARSSAHDYADIPATLAEFAAKLVQSQRTLFWIESADVNATRSAVRLAEACEATIHVAQSPGSQIFSRVMKTCGLMSCSLATMCHSATLVIHLGCDHLLQMPMLAERFLRADQEHWIIQDQTSMETTVLASEKRATVDAHGPGSSADSPLTDAVTVMWPRESWSDRLARLLLALRDESSVMQRRADQVDVEISELAQRLMASRYTVIVWGEDVLFEAADQLVVERLNELAQQVSLTNRCSLLSLTIDPGRETATDAVLWLTNLTAPIRFRNSQWQSAMLDGQFSLEELRSRFDTILCIRNLPSDRPLPNLAFDLVMDADCNAESDRGTKAAQRLLRVAAVGRDVPGHLQRADHGWAGYAPALGSDDETGEPSGSQATTSTELGARLPAADALLEELRHQVLITRSKA